MIYAYRNKKTGATFTTPCRCTGKNWEQVGEKVKAQKPKEKVEEKIIDPDDVVEVEETKKKA